MQVLPVNIDISLPDDSVVDLFLLQFHSPSPVQGGAPVKLPQDTVTRRHLFLERFQQWLHTNYCADNPTRPYFVIIPELSVSLSHLNVLQEIARTGDQQAVVVAGLEFLNHVEYTSLLEDMPSMPEPASWINDLANENRINSAVVMIHQNNGELLKFIQPKRNPSEGEATTHLNCQNALLFRSLTQVTGRRLNFCVQICSDFTDFEKVRELRLQCENAANGLSMDFMFLLQRNRDQFAQQFKRSIETYFAPPNELIDTSRGCLVFVNVASETAGKSEHWGKSMLLFPWNSIKWRTPGAPTYWLYDKPESNFQSVVLREPGSCIYWLRYKPHYLVNRVAGSGQPGPFVNSHAKAIELLDEHFPNQPNFSQIPPVTHWMLSEWREATSEFMNQLGQVSVPVKECCESSYEICNGEWEEILRSDDEYSKNILRLFFSAHRDEVITDKTP